MGTFPFLASLLAIFLLARESAAAQPGDPNAGKAKYNQFCTTCHGASGKGNGPLAAALNPKPRDHTAGEHMNGLTDDYLFNLIKNGGGAVDKSRLMPAFGGQLEDRDIRNLVAYIRSLARPPYKP